MAIFLSKFVIKLHFCVITGCRSRFSPSWKKNWPEFRLTIPGNGPFLSYYGQLKESK